MRAALIVFTMALGACAPSGEKQARVEQAAREPHLVERLVRAGLAPQAMRDQKGDEYWKVPVLAYQVGPSILYVYLYADSLARRAVTSTLDTLMAAPPGRSDVYPLRHILILQNNLAAVMVGGSDTQQERVRLALEAGLPAPSGR